MQKKSLLKVNTYKGKVLVLEMEEGIVYELNVDGRQLEELRLS